MNTVYTTTDNGRTHIAVDEFYQGSVNSYNNFLTQFVTKIFGVSSAITINGEDHYLNKKSYIKYLHLVGQSHASKTTLDSYRNFNAVQFNKLQNCGFMRNHLSTEKTERLGSKLATALVKGGDFNRIIRIVGEGANINNLFWIRDYDKRVLFSSNFTSDLPERTINNFYAAQYTPHLWAAATNNYAVKSLLEQYGANTALQGKSRHFNRVIMDIQNTVSMVPTVNYTYSHGHHSHGHRHGHHHGGHHHTPQLRARPGVDMVSHQKSHIPRYLQQ